MLGVDAAAEAIEAGRRHAEGRGLSLQYRVGAAEELVAERAAFAAVTALEVIEHVADPAAFLGLLAGLIEPGGALFVSTLNRSAKSLAVAKVGAEYLLRLLPVGTHEWSRFVTPAELASLARAAGLRMVETAGMTYSVLRREWVESRDLSINYIAMLQPA